MGSVVLSSENGKKTTYKIGETIVCILKIYIKNLVSLGRNFK